MQRSYSSLFFYTDLIPIMGHVDKLFFYFAQIEHNKVKKILCAYFSMLHPMKVHGKQRTSYPFRNASISITSMFLFLF